MAFITDDFLLHRETARRLYRRFAADQILDEQLVGGMMRNIGYGNAAACLGLAHPRESEGV